MFYAYVPKIYEVHTTSINNIKQCLTWKRVILKDEE